ncbi:hypothetical protein GCM10023238_15620 [Streptomyces heliomycini]
MLGGLLAAVVLTGGGHLYATRPRPQPPAGPAPAESGDHLVYLNPQTTGAKGAPRNFVFEVGMTAESDPQLPSPEYPSRTRDCP